MRAIDTILQLQNEFYPLDEEWNILDKTPIGSVALVGRASREAWIAEINSKITAGVPLSSFEQADASEHTRYVTRLNALTARGEEIVAEINTLATSLGLPNFNATLEPSGFIDGTGNVKNFSINGREILNTGIYVEYKVDERPHYVVLTTSEEIVASYVTGSSGWRLSGLGSRMIQEADDYAKIKVKGGFDFDRQVPTTDVLIISRDGSGEHHHFVVDDEGNVIFDEWRG